MTLLRAEIKGRNRLSTTEWLENLALGALPVF